jgi:hypothetical protein
VTRLKETPVKTLLLPTLAAAAALITACSSGSTAGHGSADNTASAASPPPPPASTSTSVPAQPAALPNACALITRAEAQRLAGVKLNKAQYTPPTAGDATGICGYDAPVTGSSGSVQIFVQHDIPRALQIDKAIHHKFRVVAGIGDQTLEEPENASIFTRKGDVWVYLSVPYGTTPQKLENAAHMIAAHLP